MQSAKDPYFILSVIFGAVGVYFWFALIPFLALLGVHLYVCHIKSGLQDKAFLNSIIARVEQVERHITFKR